MADNEKHTIKLSQPKGFGQPLYIADCSCGWYVFARVPWERDEDVKEHLEKNNVRVVAGNSAAECDGQGAVGGCGSTKDASDE